MTDTSGITTFDEVVVTGRRLPPPPKIGPFPVNVPKCFIDIYPFEGGTYTLENGPHIAVAVEKKIGGEPGGNFQIVMPPGGPLGNNSPPSWTEIITPMSLVVIGMRRGAHSQVVMVGLVLQVSEQNDWEKGDRDQRKIMIVGQDLGYYFSLSTFYSAWYLGATGFSFDAGGIAGTTMADPVLGQGLQAGTPDAMARAWYELVMAGTKGTFSNTFVPYRGARVKFGQAFGTWFEHYSAGTNNVFAAYLMSSDETWAQKFKALLPPPWYEFFVITAPTGFYPAATGGFPFFCRGLGLQYTSSPQIIGRLNPTPTLTAHPDNTAPVFTGMDATQWNALPVFDLEGYDVRSSTQGFDESSILNYFTLNPTGMQPLQGQTNSQVAPYIYSFSAVGDSASIERYGFRPANGQLSWLSDPTGQIARMGDANGDQLIADLMARFCSTYSPLALMARATVVTFLRPDIMPGCVFRYQPWKHGPTWDFYIDGVAHRFDFGSNASTTLTLSRGLPTAVYADQGSSGLLFNIHTGNAERVNGVYQPTLPPGSAPPLKAIPGLQQQQFFAALAKAYVQPQGGTAP